ncbi:MAG: SLBB domain-containing protein, partial [Bacteroidota bacterium]
QDIVLRDGDKIVVPSRFSSVFVFGQVVSPGHIPFGSGLSVKHYIEKAGGFTSEALGGEVKVIKASTKQWLSPSETTLEDGDAIWVPKDIKQPFSYYMGVVGQAASVVGVVLSMTLIVLQLTSN